ncbi:hypothetical protein TNCV_2559591 [Trichonephila clavipes]|nr:hypothetical protein TNCV_2559591 [Trichonephila clavipes]
MRLSLNICCFQSLLVQSTEQKHWLWSVFLLAHLLHLSNQAFLYATHVLSSINSRATEWIKMPLKAGEKGLPGHIWPSGYSLETPALDDKEREVKGQQETSRVH